MKKPKIYSSSFLGKQLSRIKLGQSYYGIVVSTISAIALLKLAFDIDLFLIIVMFPIFLLGAYIIGYYLDIKNITTMDVLKTNEISNRFLNKADQKRQEFELMMMEVLLEGINKLNSEKKIDTSELMEKYRDYKNRWTFGASES